MTHLFDFLSQQLHSNQFFSGAALTGVLLAVIAFLRGWLVKAWQMGARRVVVSFTVHSEDPLYVPLQQWLKDHRFDAYAQRYRIRSAYDDTNRDNGQPISTSDPSNAIPTAVFGPDYGTYTFRHAGKWLFVSVEKEGDAAGQGSSRNAQTREFLTIRYFGLSRAVMEAIMAEVIAKIEAARVQSIPVMVAKSYGWQSSGVLARHPQDKCPVVLANHILEDIVQDVETFFDKREWYAQRGIPWRRGYLLHGPPGTGKTSLCRYIAQHFGLSVYVIDAAGYMSSDFASSLKTIPPRSLVLFEDIDCHVHARKEDAPGQAVAGANPDLMPINIGTLLNAIDGINPPEQVLIFMTTNHPDNLDAALTRPGRIDRRFQLGPCTRAHACLLFDKFYPDAPAHPRTRAVRSKLWCRTTC